MDIDTLRFRNADGTSPTPEEIAQLHTMVCSILAAGVGKGLQDIDEETAEAAAQMEHVHFKARLTLLEFINHQLPDGVTLYDGPPF